MDIATFLTRFDRSLKTDGQWLVRCPGHDDRKASLAVREGDGGRIVLFCHAGCTIDRILESMQLRASDLFAKPSTGNGRREVAAYDYRDVDGSLLCQSVRYEPKDFRQRRPDGQGGWIWNLKGVPRVVYRLPELYGKDAVVVVEGEKDVDACWAAGIPATCNISGAGKWRTEYAQQLIAAGVKRIRIIPDNDRAGLEHADMVAQSCSDAGLDARIVALPSMAEKADVSDYLAAHAKQDLIALLKAAPEQPSVPSPITITPPSLGLDFVAIGDLLDEPDEVVDWLVRDRVPSGSLVLLAGKPKAGKSTLARDLALQVAKGGQWLDWKCSAGPVWYLVFEDKRSEVKNHFRKMGATSADPVRFLFKQPGSDILAELYKLAERERPALIIVDTLQRLIRARDLNDYAEVTTKLTPVLALSRELGSTLLLVHHAGKGERTGLDSVLGSTALAGSVDNIFLFGRSEKYRVLSSQQRIGPDLEQTVVLFDEDSGRVTAGQTRENADIEAMKAEMLSVLRDALEPMTEKDLLKEVEGRTKLKRPALRAMVGVEIQRSGRGVRKDPYLYSCLVVPSYIREQETEKAKISKRPDKQGSDSRSPNGELLPGAEHSLELEKPDIFEVV
jgi:putative DNA primase/helicase